MNFRIRNNWVRFVLWEMLHLFIFGFWKVTLFNYIYARPVTSLYLILQCNNIIVLCQTRLHIGYSHNGNAIFYQWVKSFVNFDKMRNNSSAPDHNWDARLAWYFSCATGQISFYGLEHSLRIHCFKPPWPTLIIKIPATCAKFLEPFGYSTVPSAFSITNVFGLLPRHSHRVRTRKASFPDTLYFICSSFKSGTKWCNAQRVSAWTTAILSTGTYLGLNHFCHVASS